MSPIRRPIFGTGLVLVGGMLFILNAAVVRGIQGSGVDAATLTSVRVTLTGLVLFGVVLLRGERLRMPPTWRDAAIVLGFAITGLALVQYFYLIAIARLPMGLALLIEFSAPMLVALYARFVHHEQVRQRLWFALICSLGGLALVAEVWHGFTLNLIGVLAAFGAALALATYFIVGEHSVGGEPPLHVITKAFLVAAVLFNLISPFWRLGSYGLGEATSLNGRLSGISVPLWVLVASFVILGTAVPFMCELSALRHLSATEVSLISMLEPVGVTVLGWAWFRESLSVGQIIGVAIVLVGIALAQTSRINQPEPHEPPLVA